jgi:hypothetical protein
VSSSQASTAGWPCYAALYIVNLLWALFVLDPTRGAFSGRPQSLITRETKATCVAHATV